MLTIVGILTFMSKINFVLSLVEHEKSSITSGPGPTKYEASSGSIMFGTLTVYVNYFENK